VNRRKAGGDLIIRRVVLGMWAVPTVTAATENAMGEVGWTFEELAQRVPVLLDKHHEHGGLLLGRTFVVGAFRVVLAGAEQLPVDLLGKGQWQRVGDDDGSPEPHPDADLVERGNVLEDFQIEELSQINVVGSETLAFQQAALDKAIDNASKFFDGDVPLPALMCLTDRPRLCERHQNLKNPTGSSIGAPTPATTTDWLLLIEQTIRELTKQAVSEAVSESEFMASFLCARDRIDRLR
jgi:hypothetical protein